MSKHTPFEKRIIAFYKGQAELLANLSLAKKGIINFPKNKRPTFMQKMCISFIEAGGGFIDEQFVDIKK